jgi:hypothetical protein
MLRFFSFFYFFRVLVRPVVRGSGLAPIAFSIVVETAVCPASVREAVRAVLLMRRHQERLDLALAVVVVVPQIPAAVIYPYECLKTVQGNFMVER